MLLPRLQSLETDDGRDIDNCPMPDMHAPNSLQAKYFMEHGARKGANRGLPKEESRETESI